MFRLDEEVTHNCNGRPAEVFASYMLSTLVGPAQQFDCIMRLLADHFTVCTSKHPLLLAGCRLCKHARSAEAISRSVVKGCDGLRVLGHIRSGIW